MQVERRNLIPSVGSDRADVFPKRRCHRRPQRRGGYLNISRPASCAPPTSASLLSHLNSLTSQLISITMFAQSVFRTVQQPLKCARLPRPVRRGYATESSSGSSSSTTVFGALAAVAGLGAGYYYLNRPSPVSKSSTDTTREAPKSPHPAEEVSHTSSSASTSAPNATFQGGQQGWVSLKLESVEQYNHNTKKFRFILPNPDDVSGLKIAC